MIQLDLQNRQPIYEQLIAKMNELISLEVLSPNDQLPSVRALARDLGVNPNTVQKAYQELERQGIIYSVAGKGSFIAPNGKASEILLEQNIQRLKNALQEGRRAGVTKTIVINLVHEVYKKET